MVSSAISQIDDKTNQQQIKAEIQNVVLPKIINNNVCEASKIFGIKERDIRAFIKIESSFRPWVRGTSGEYGLMQIMPDEFENYGNDINEFLDDKNIDSISWETKYDKFHPRTNIMIGTYSYKKRLKRHDNHIWAAMAYNVGDGGARKTKTSLLKRGRHWYCVQIKKSIRRGRQFTYSYKFARNAGRLSEWKAIFGDIPKNAMEAFWAGRGDSFCKKLLTEDMKGT